MNKKYPGKILIIDDNEKILKSLKLLLKNEFGFIEPAKDPERIPALLSEYQFDIILLDMNFKAGIHSGNEGIFWLRKILTIDPGAVVILITAYGDIELAVKAMKEGAVDFIQKPWDPDKLIATLRSALALRQTRMEVKALQNKQQALNENMNVNREEIVGNSPPMMEVFKMINKVAGTDANVLILGENGTGKELIAREIHRKSKRCKQAFVPVDLGSISESLFESEIFGHVKGSFTDAREDRMGRLESANGGTLFLDELGNLPVSLQTKILSVLQNREVYRIGSGKSIPINIRLISATNRVISEMISQNLFREDLYFRINTIEIILPPLRQRGFDIVLLAEYYLNKLKRKYNKPDLRITQQALDKLLKYSWPGNIRELKHTVEKAVILSDSASLTPDCFYLGDVVPQFGHFPSHRLEDVEKNLISQVVDLYRGNMSKVAKELNISRTTLYAKIKKYGL